MSTKEILARFHEIASDPAAMKEKYMADGKKIVLTAPVYTPEEIIHSMGLVPMGAWGADIRLKEAKRYFPAFICSIVQSIVELGMNGTYRGVSAIVIPGLCDSLKVTGENWKYAVPDIPFIAMTYPQNRKPDYARDFTRAGYERLIKKLEEAAGASFDDEALKESIKIYNAHNAAMREISELIAVHGEVSARERSDVYKSAFFMLKEDHTALVKALAASLREDAPVIPAKKIMTEGILADSPSLLDIIDENGLHIVCDDVAAESRQYRTDAPEGVCGLESLAEKFSLMDSCSVLYDPQKKRVDDIAADAKKHGADGVLIILTKFCDPEEFDNPMIRKACEKAGIPSVITEIDRQMSDYAQTRTIVETFRELL